MRVRFPFPAPKVFCLARLRDVHTHRWQRRVRLVWLRTLGRATSVRIRHTPKPSFGDIAQLGERIHGMDEVRGSTPLISTKFCSRSSGEVAQLGERIVRNDEVAGSTPVFSTRFALLVQW